MLPPVAPAAAETRSGFRSFKALAPIFYPRRWHRDLLIQLTLDPTVEAIAPSPLGIDEIGGCLFAVLAWRNGEAFVVAISDDPIRPSSGRLACGLPLAVLTRAHLEAEPRAGTSRLIWSTRASPVSAGDRLRVLRVLDDAPDGVPLGTLVKQVERPEAEGVDSVLALVCAGVLEMDVSRHVAPETVVRRYRGRVTSPRDALLPAICA